MRAYISEFFEVLPELVFAQAFTILDARLPTPQGESWFLIFGRFAKTSSPPDGVTTTGDGSAFGVQVVAYRCDGAGVVADWERRYQTFGMDAELAVRNLRLQIANGTARLFNVEGSLARARQIEEDVYRLNIGDDFLSSIPPQ